MPTVHDRTGATMLVVPQSLGFFGGTTRHGNSHETPDQTHSALSSQSAGSTNEVAGPQALLQIHGTLSLPSASTRLASPKLCHLDQAWKLG